MSATEAFDRIASVLPTGSTFLWEGRDDAISLETLRIPKAYRGVGSLFLARIVSEADRHGTTLTLAADPTDVPDDPGLYELVVWYVRFGFVPEGITRDGWVEMRRDPLPFVDDHETASTRARQAKGSDMTREEFEDLRTALAAVPGP